MVPSEPRAHAERAHDGAPGIQRIANRPIICHVLDALRNANGTTELAVIAAGVIAEVRASIKSKYKP